MIRLIKLLNCIYILFIVFVSFIKFTRDLSYQNIKSIPNSIYLLKNLKELYVDRLEYTITCSRSYKGFYIAIN